MFMRSFVVRSRPLWMYDRQPVVFRVGQGGLNIIGNKKSHVSGDMGGWVDK